jgi:hypothetical protein
MVEELENILARNKDVEIPTAIRYPIRLNHQQTLTSEVFELSTENETAKKCNELADAFISD